MIVLKLIIFLKIIIVISFKNFLGDNFDLINFMTFWKLFKKKRGLQYLIFVLARNKDLLIEI